MKKMLLLIGLTFITSLVFAKTGDISLQNVNQYHSSEDVIRFKLVTKDLNNQVVNEVYSPAIAANGSALILKDELGITDGYIDYYIENVTQKTGFKKCLPDLGYYIKYTTVIGGWYNNNGFECVLMED